MLTASVPATVAVFCSLCEQVQSESSLTIKTEIIRGFLKRYSGDVVLLFSLLLPKHNGRLYHMQDKQLIKILAGVLKVGENTLKTDLQSTGCIGQTAIKFFHNAKQHSDMTLEDFDQYLTNLSNASGDAGQSQAISNFTQHAAKKDLFMFLREVKQDIRLGAGIRTVLSGLHEKASDMFKNCANVVLVVKNVLAGKTDPNAVAQQSPNGKGGVTLGKGNNNNNNMMMMGNGNNANNDDDSNSVMSAPGNNTGGITLGYPIGPMLAAPSKGCAQVIAKCPNGAFSETKYDGERIQIHKNGNKFSFFARSLKPMKADKYEGLEEFIKQSVPEVQDVILDGEILLYDKVKKQPLPFGTLGKHKKGQFTDACTCIFIFDILYLNGESLLKTPMNQRRELMCKTIRVVPNRILLSELREIKGTSERKTTLLKAHLNQAVKEGLEGLVVKDVLGSYDPRSRHWIKLKKDYLDGCADTVDMVVLGAWYGSGAKGGLLNTFLMGVLDKTMPSNSPRRWKTVTKCTNGLDDLALAQVNNNLKRITSPCNKASVPNWLDVNSSHVPEVIVNDPTQSVVWEIMTTEFSKTKRHTANQISMRFPRIKQQRGDKTWREATSLEELEKLVVASKETNDGLEVLQSASDEDDVDEEEQQRRYTRVDPKYLAQRILGENGEVEVDFSNQQQQQPQAQPRAQQQANNQQQQRKPSPPRQNQQQQRATPATAAAPTATSTGAPPKNTSTSNVKYSNLQLPQAFKTAFPHGHLHFHDVTQPIKITHHHANNSAISNNNILIIHCVALKAKWMQNRGVMGSINMNLGTKAQKTYEATCDKAQLGNVAFVKMDTPSSNNNNVDEFHVANLYVIDEIIGTPVVELKHLDTAFGKCQQYAKNKNCQIHIALPSDTRTVEDWPLFAKLLAKHFSDDDIACALYIRGDKKYGHPLYYRQEEQQQQQKPAPINKKDDDLFDEEDDGPRNQLQLKNTLRRENTDYERNVSFFNHVVAAILYDEQEAESNEDYKKKIGTEAKDLKNSLTMIGANDIIFVKNSSDPALLKNKSITHFVKTSNVTPMFIASLPPPSQRSFAIVNKAWVKECSKQNRLLPPPADLNDAKKQEQRLDQDGSSSTAAASNKEGNNDDDDDTESYYADDNDGASSTQSSVDTADYHFGDEDDENGGAVTPPDFSDDDNDNNSAEDDSNNMMMMGGSSASKKKKDTLPLSSCRLAFDRTALGAELADKLTNLVISLGATVHPRIRGLSTEKESKTTHFISVEDRITAEARRALDLSVPAVGQTWINDCANQKKLIAVSSEYIVGQQKQNKQEDAAVAEPEVKQEADEITTTASSKQQQQKKHTNNNKDFRRRERTPDFTQETNEMQVRNENLHRKSQNIARAQPFKQFRVFVAGYAPETKEVLWSVLGKGGAMLLDHAPTTQPNQAGCHSLIVADTLSTEVHAALSSSSSSIPVVSRTWIDESLKNLSNKVPFSDYVYTLNKQTQKFETPCWQPLVASSDNNNETQAPKSNNNNTNNNQDDAARGDSESTVDYENDNNNNDDADKNSKTPIDDDDNAEPTYEEGPLADYVVTVACTNPETKEHFEKIVSCDDVGGILVDWVTPMRVASSQQKVIVVVNKATAAVDAGKAKERVSKMANPAWKRAVYVNSDWLLKVRAEKKAVPTGPYQV